MEKSLLTPNSAGPNATLEQSYFPLLYETSVVARIPSLPTTFPEKAEKATLSPKGPQINNLSFYCYLLGSS